MGFAASNPQVLTTWGLTPELVVLEEVKLKKYKEIIQKDPKALLENVENSWKEWFKRYEARLCQETAGGQGDDIETLKQHRINRMNQTNPVYVLRNYMAQEAINQAEQGNFKAIDDLLELLLRPFEEKKEGKSQEYKKCSPKWASGICVSCSS